MSTDIGDILKRRAAAVERKLAALRKDQSDRLQVIRRLELQCNKYERHMRRLGFSRSDAVTVLDIDEASQDGMHHDRILRKTRERVSNLRIEFKQIARQRESHRDALVSIQHKAGFLRDRRKTENRIASRRRLTRELAGD